MIMESSGICKDKRGGREGERESEFKMANNSEASTFSQSGSKHICVLTWRGFWIGNCSELQPASLFVAIKSKLSSSSLPTVNC